MTRPLSLAALTVLELSPPDMVACAAEAGYSHVGLRLLPATANELTVGRRIAAAARKPNAGVLVDPIHFDRGGNVPADIGGVGQERLHYAQLCDAPAERPRDTETLLHQARAERLMPGDGGLNLMGILRALPPELPLALEVPMVTLAKTVPAVERARRIRAKTEALLARLAEKSPTA